MATVLPNVILPFLISCSFCLKDWAVLMRAAHRAVQDQLEPQEAGRQISADRRIWAAVLVNKPVSLVDLQT